MPTPYVEDVPAEVYEAVRTRAKQNRTSISAEVLKLLAAGVPTSTELARRQAIIQRLGKLRTQRPPATAQSARTSTVDLVREDRGR
jgi:DNA polymerase III delta subunit